MSKQGTLISVANDQEGASPFIVTPTTPFPTDPQDNFTQIVDQYVMQFTATSSTVATETAINDYTVELVSSTGFLVGDYVHINTTNTENTNPQITIVTGDTLTLDRRLDKVHLVGATVTKVIIDMALTGQTGTLASPQEYSATPPLDEVWHITRMLFSMIHGTAGDLGLFGNLAKLTNGVVIRVYQSGEYHTYSNWKNNADIKGDIYDLDFDSRSGGQGSFGTSGRGTFLESGSVIRLDGALGDKFEVYIQDDITAMGFFGMKIEGHIEDV